jgi:hypothetical protein
MGAALKWGAAAIAVVVLVVAVSFGFRWLGAATEVAGPDNVRQQFGAVIEDWNAMEAAAANVCGASNSEGSRQGTTFLEDPAFAYKAQYRRIAVDYNRRQANIFEAKVVGPGGYPRVAPTLAEMQARVC